MSLGQNGSATLRISGFLHAKNSGYGSIAVGLAASALLLSEHLTRGDIVAGLFLVTALGLSMVPVSLLSPIGYPEAGDIHTARR